METVRFTLSEKSLEGLEALRGDLNRLFRVMTAAQMIPSKGESLEEVTTKRDEFRQDVAKRVHRERTLQGVTLEVLSERTGLPVRFLEHIENGSLVNLDSSHLARLASGLAVPLEAIGGETPSSEPVNDYLTRARAAKKLEGTEQEISGQEAFDSAARLEAIRGETPSSEDKSYIGGYQKPLYPPMGNSNGQSEGQE